MLQRMPVLTDLGIDLTHATLWHHARPMAPEMLSDGEPPPRIARLHDLDASNLTARLPSDFDTTERRPLNYDPTTSVAALRPGDLPCVTRVCHAHFPPKIAAMAAATQTTLTEISAQPPKAAPPHTRAALGKDSHTVHLVP